MKKILFTSLFCFIFTYAYAQDSIRFGVFAYKGIEETAKQYRPLVDELNKKLDNRLILEVLTQEEMNEKIKNKELDIITTNPVHFLYIRQQYDLSGAMATLRGFKNGIATSKLAGVIIVRKDSPIETISNLKNKVIATPSKKHLGGFRTQVYELYLKGINIEEESKDIIELKDSHQDIVRAVLNKKADIGFIRDGILEEMISKGELDSNSIKIINEYSNSYHPYKISTKLYPEWPVFSMPHMNEEDVKTFISALFSLKPTPALKGVGIYDYTLPADYLEMEQLSRTLKLPPFDKTEQIYVFNILYRYKFELAAIFAALLAGLLYHLRERKRKFLLDSLLSNMGEGVYGVDAEGKCIWINKKALELLGYDEKEVLGKDQHKLFHHHKPSNEEYAPNECPIYKTSKDKKTRVLEEHFIKKDGSFMPINLIVTPLKNGGAIVVFRDISELLDKQIRLEKSESLFRTLFDIFPEPIVITDIETKLPYKFNEAAYTQLGYSIDEYKNISIDKYDAIESKNEIQKHIDAVFEHARDDFDTLHRKKDGSLLDISVSVRVIHIEEKPYLLSIHRDITKVKRYQRDLLHQKQRLDSIIEGTNVGTWEWDVQIGSVVLSEKWAQIIGYTLEELFPISIETWTKLTHPEDLAESQKLLQKHFSGETDYYECEVRMKHKEGHWVWVLDRGKVSSRNDDGKPELMSGTHQDITAKKSAQEALRTERDLFSEGPVITIEWAPIENWPVRYVSKNVLSILGYTYEEMISESFLYTDLIHPEDIQNISNEVSFNMKNGIDTFEQSYRLKLKEGNYKWFYDFTKILRDENSNPTSIRGYLFDQSQLKKVQDDLANLNNQLESLLKSIPDLVWMKDKDGLYVTCNKRFEAFFGASVDDIVGKTDYDFIPEDLADFFREHDQNAMKSDIPLTNFEEIEFANDGHIEFLQTTKVAVKDKNGEIMGVLGIGRDLTELKQNEQALKAAKEAADRANRSKSEFLANMSHEIRTPMNAILGLSELMLDSKLDLKEKDYLHKIHVSSKMLLGIINDILDYSKIEANKLEIEHREFDLDNVLSQLKTIFTQNAIDKGLELFFEFKNLCVKTVIGDELRVNQVLVNLLSNAIKFTHEGSVALYIELKEKSEHTALIKFSVIDTGIGITEEELPKLFAPFSQADSSITRKYGGTGLGLSISKKLVEAMGGKLNAQSQRGVGSTFSFEIEFQVGSWRSNTLESVDDIKTSYSNAEQDLHSLKNIKVLLVEDNEINQEVAIAMLKKIEADVIVANNGKEAVATFLSGRDYFDIILMDLQMPIMNGYEAAAVIREHDKEIPIIALTAAAMVEDKEKALKAGMNDHLSKPINSNEIVKTIAKWCKISAPIEDEKMQISQNNDADLDIEYALYIVNSNKELLNKILSGFLLELEGEFDAIPMLLANNDPAAAPLIHSLKGVSGNVGAKRVESISKALEAEHKKNGVISNESIKNLCSAIDRLKTEIRSTQKAMGQNIEKSYLSDEESKELFQEILRNVKIGTMIRYEKQKMLYEWLKGRVNAYELEEWQGAIDEFDYDKAYAIMKEWKL